MDIEFLITRLLLASAVLGVIILIFVKPAVALDRKIAAGDLKAATKKAWMATGFLILFVVAGVFDLIRRESLSMTLCHWVLVLFCAFKFHETWSVARRLQHSNEDEPSSNPGPD
ncbi:MAG TPA: hypothetical protein VFW40_12940 [Capsulimonadaceae bacterium]|nr:hypothetical protein [Capsulimonadaceae bacterium]